METLHFRIFFWQKFIPLLGAGALAAVVLVSPVTQDWSVTTWQIAGGVAGGAAAYYLFNAWRRSDVRLDETGLTVYIGATLETWPYDKLLKVRQMGQYRVKMCFDPDVPDKHMHITLDIFGSGRFVDALLDRYADTQGHELPELESHAA